MNTLRTKRSCAAAAGFLAAAAVLSAAPPTPAGPDTATAPLGKRYLDSHLGVSLRPPVGAQRQRGLSRTRQTVWRKRDTRNRAVVLELRVLQRLESKAKIDLAPYSKALAEKIRREERFDVESVRVTKVAGKGAIDIRGRLGGQLGLWQRRVWIWAQPGRFVIVMISGPAPKRKDTEKEREKERLDATLQAILDSLEVFDPAKMVEQRKPMLERGRKLLASLTDKKLQAVFQAKRRWFLVRRKDQDVGYMTYATQPKRDGRRAGYEIRSYLNMSIPKAPPVVVGTMMFSTADRNLEKWRRDIVTGAGRRARQSVEQGTKQKELIVCSFPLQPGRDANRSLKKPAMDIYIPGALGMVLPRLVDLKVKQSYGFAAYNSAANGIDLRTLTVAGPAKISLAGRHVEAARLVERMAVDAEKAYLWVDSEGEILRMQTTDGLLMERSTRSAVLRRFPKGAEKIQALGLDGTR